MKDIKLGRIISGDRWPEPIIIKSIEELGSHIHLVGVTLTSNTHIDQILTKEEFEKLINKKSMLSFGQEAWKIFLALETTRYRYASLYDPLLAMNISKVDPLPHQIEAVYGYILNLNRIRYLIADDPGAGKTIMAGLIIKELKLRRIIKRILIIAPGHLKDQWRRELKDRFKEDFIIVDRSIFESHYRLNIWEKENQIITSMDFAKRDEILQTLASTSFDLVIVDEAHKMSAYKYGEKINKSERYKLGEVISKVSHHLLFLTSTPHKGDPENFRLFIDLLMPGFFATKEMLEESIENKDNHLFLKRTKEDLKDFEGKPLFLPRYVKTVTFELGTSSPMEKELYNELSRYVENQYNLAEKKDRKRNVGFALVILQRRLASSTYALLKSLERRKKRLEELLSNPESQRAGNLEFKEMEETEDMAEEERWKKEAEWEGLSAADTKEELLKEIQTVDKLIEKAKYVLEKESEIKLTKLKESLEELSIRVREKERRKILIFTEARDTLEWLKRNISKWGYSVNEIHGNMKLEDRIKAEAVFKNEKEVMVATEAAGEGINLQFCNLMINYDLPWNPNRLEQRMGRIHRYGQTREVFIHNLVAGDTREGKVLLKLFDKIEEIKKALGSDKVFDVLGEIIEGKKFVQAITDAAVNARNIDEILKEMDLDIKVDEDYINKIKENLGETLATRYIDYTRIKEMAQKAKEYRLIPEYVENFFLKAFEKAGGKVRKLKNGIISIESIPYDIKRIAKDENFKMLYGYISGKYPKATFDKEIYQKDTTLEFISFGHPLFEAVLLWVENNFLEVLQSGAIFYDPEGNLDGYIVFFEGEIKDGTGEVAGKRLFSFFTDLENVREVSPAIIWDLAEENSPSEKTEIPVEEVERKTQSFAISALERYMQELLKEREREAKIKEKYGIKSLEYLIVKLDGDLIDLEERKQRGEEVDIAIWNKQDRKKEYEKAKEELKDTIKREQVLTMSMPRFLGIIKVEPLRQKDSEMKSDPEIEKIGMEYAMEYEKSEGRNPEDVSSENLGFDIRSTDKEGNKRYIEVKTRAGIGDIALTQNEWFKAQRFLDDYYLYVIFNASSKPELFIIKNPAKNLKAEQKIELVRYKIESSEILEKGEKSV